MTRDGQWIVCDGEGCDERVRAPVSLRKADGSADVSIAGWLYVNRHGNIEHYCERCKTVYLGTLARSGAEAPANDH